MLLTGRRLIVTGAAMGIGAATAREFVRQGAAVACLDIDEDAGRAAAAKLDGTAYFVRCDVADKASVDAAVDEAVDRLGGLNGAVAAAGIHEAVPAADLSVESWRRMFDVHVLGTVLVNQAAFRHLRTSGGRLINMGSGVAAQGQRLASREGDAHYASAKAAIMAWTRGVAREWGRYGITVNTIVPATWTPMYQSLRDSMSPAELAAHDAAMEITIPIGGRNGDADTDYAPVATFLASDMSRYVTGQVLAANGGLFMFG